MKKMAIIVLLFSMIFSLSFSAFAAEPPLDKEELEAINSIETAAGQIINVYSDGRYEYYLDKESGDLLSIALTAEYMENVISRYSETREKIAEEDAIKVVNEALEKWFPEINKENLTIKCNEQSGNPVEEYIYLLEEIEDNTRINVVSISITYEGELAGIYGTHNTPDMFEKDLVVSTDDACEIALAYMISNKAHIEENMRPSDPVSENTTILAEKGMIVPDGVSIGEEFELTILPDYELYISSMEDINEISIIKVMYKGQVAWALDFSVETSWGEFSEVFNPVFSLIINAETGEVMEALMTDGMDKN